MYPLTMPWGVDTCSYRDRPCNFGDEIRAQLPGAVENTYINIRYGHGSGRDGIAPLVVVGEGQTMHLIKAKNKGLKAMRRL